MRRAFLRRLAAAAWVLGTATACGSLRAAAAIEAIPLAARPEVASATPRAAAPQTPAAATPGPGATPTVAEGLPEVIGTSVAGRPLEVFRFGSGPRELLIVAGIHGGYEWNTIALADELIELLRREPERVPPEVTLYLLRAINPDGEARSHGYEGRANENGVDLNRNWPVNWHLDWDRTYCWHYLPITAGEHPLSEPETQAVLRFILDHEFDGVISYHSAALGIFPGGSPPDTASARLAEAVAAVSGYRYPPRDYGCEYTGQFADWAISQGIPAVDVELTNHDETDFEINVAVLETFLTWSP
jgi:predicted deacylase